MDVASNFLSIAMSDSIPKTVPRSDIKCAMPYGYRTLVAINVELRTIREEQAKSVAKVLPNSRKSRWEVRNSQ